MEVQPGTGWLAAGITAVAATLGFMVGASASPVAGLAITATFGVVAACFGFLYQRELLTRSKPASGADNALVLPESVAGHGNRLPSYLGQLMVLFATSLLIGSLIGSYSRLEVAARRAAVRSFPWSVSDAPATAYDAVDWLVAAEKLQAMGYSDTQIAQLYKIRVAEKSTKNFNSTPPISSLLNGSSTEQRPIDLGPIFAHQPPNPSRGSNDGRM